MLVITVNLILIINIINLINKSKQITKQDYTMLDGMNATRHRLDSATELRIYSPLVKKTMRKKIGMLTLLVYLSTSFRDIMFKDSLNCT